MSVVTLQIGQCGNQLGSSLFEALARDAADDAAREVFFRRSYDARGEDDGADITVGARDNKQAVSGGGKKRWTARAVLVDTEPKVVESAAARAARSAAAGSDWSYAGAARLSRDSGAANNWALGHHGYGPLVREEALDLARREAERCDWLDGFLLLQSAAGGTGAGLGTALAEALADDLAAGAGAPLACACVWPYDAGDVAPQPYNALLALAGLAGAADAVFLLHNEALHAACARALGLPRPGFGDLNGVAAAALAGALLPARERPASAAAADASLAAAAPLLRPLGDVCARVACSPRYRIASLRHAPLLAPGTADFTPLSWPPLLRRLRQQAVTGAFLDDGAVWATTAPASPSRGPHAPGLPAHRYRNAAAASALFLRGRGAAEADASEFADARWHAPWAADPLLVAASPLPAGRGGGGGGGGAGGRGGRSNGGAALSATLLAADQSAVAPVRRTLAAGRRMAAARAYVHQYEAHGVEEAALLAAFAAVEDVVAAYDALR